MIRIMHKQQAKYIYNKRVSVSETEAADIYFILYPYF